MFGEGAQFDEEAHHVSPGDVLHHKEQVLAVLKREEELHDPFVVGLGENVSFGLHVRDLVPSENIHFPEGLHCVKLLRVLLPYQCDHPESPQPKRFDRVEHVVVEFRPLEPQKVGLFLVEDSSHLLRGVFIEISLRHFHL